MEEKLDMQQNQVNINRIHPIVVIEITVFILAINFIFLACRQDSPPINILIATLVHMAKIVKIG